MAQSQHPERRKRQEAPERGSVRPAEGATGPTAGEAAASGFGRLCGRLWPYGVLAGAVIVFFFPLLSSSPDERMSGIDITYYFQWIHQYARDELLAGRIPLWNPYSYGGIPFAANPQCSVFYPPSWLYLLVPVIHAHKWMIGLHAFLAGAFMHLYLRRVGLGQAAATVACLPWMFGGYFMANAAVGHLTMIFTMAWLPLAMYCCERALQSRRVRWLFWTGFVLGVQILAGEPQNCYYSGLLVAVYGLVRAAGGAASDRPRWHPARYGRWLGGLALIGLVAALTAGVQFLLTAEYLLHSDRAANTYEFATNRSFPFTSFLGFMIPWSSDVRGLTFSAGDRIVYVEMNWEFAGYVGIFTLVLAALSLGVRRNAPLMAVKVVLAVAVILMLGRHTPLYRLLFTGLAGLNLFRVPARALVIAVWALSVMTGFGLEWLFEQDRMRWRAARWRRIAMTGLTLVAAGMILEICFGGIAKQVPRDDNWWATIFEPISFADLVILGPIVLPLTGAVLLALLPHLPRRAAIGAVAGLIAADLLWATPSFHLNKYSPDEDYRLRALVDLRADNDSQEPLWRLDASPSQVPANLCLGARVENINGYWPFAMGRFYRFVHRMRGHEPSPLDRHQFGESIYDRECFFPLRIMNVRYAFRRDEGLKAFVLTENDGRLPRAWLVERFEVLAEEDAAIERLKQPAFDPARVVILERDPGVEFWPADSPIGTCVVRKLDGGGLDIETDTARPALLVMSEIFYPGWRARVDGRVVPLLRADDVISAIHLPAGGHHITLRYEPTSFKLGCVATGSCVLAALAVLLAGRRRGTEE